MGYEIRGIQAFYPYIKPDWQEIIGAQPKELLEKATELRFRAGSGCTLSCGEQNYDVEGISVTVEDISLVLDKICRGARYHFERQISNGYISLKGGHRVGICGTYTKNENDEVRIADISSLNFRLCRDVKINADKLLEQLLEEGRLCSTLIISEPCGGKTTMLTDLVRGLSKKGIRTAVIDERGEIAAVFQGAAQKELGGLADVLDGYPKPYGMMIALRTLAPQVLVCDEIGTAEEMEKMLESIHAGVPILVTAHAQDEEELYSRPQIKRLIDAGAIKKIVVLKGAKAPGRVRKVITVKPYDYETAWSNFDN